MAQSDDMAVAMHGIVKRFGSHCANDHVDFLVRAGEIHALVGENGAGKTTLMKCLAGLYRPDAGTVAVDQRPVRFAGPRDAILAGIGMVHQHFMLVPTLTAAENLGLGQEPTRMAGLCLDLARLRTDLSELAKNHGLTVDPDALVADLSVGEQQRLEILKVLYRGARILVLDEPTAVLTPPEVESLFRVLRSLASAGRTIILITHRLREVMAVSDRVTVLRQGQTVWTGPRDATNESNLATAMVGRPVDLGRSVDHVDATATALPVLRLEGVCARSNRGLPALDHLDLAVHPGEIVGVAGVEGNGQTELIEVIAGLRSSTSGRMTTPPPSQVAHIPEDRQRRGLVASFSTAENLALGRHRERAFGPCGWLRPAAVRAAGQAIIHEADIRPSDPDMPVLNLSGGNQQKVVVARELGRNPRLLIAAQPTRGVDIGAVEAIRERVLRARDQGAAVLLISADLDEILALSDRIVVLYRGRVVGQFAAGTVDETRLGLLMSGGQA